MKIEQRASDLAKLIAKIDGVANQLRQAQASMITDGPEVIEIDVSTATGYINWLEAWAEKVVSTRRTAKTAADGRKFQENLRASKGKRAESKARK